MLLEVNVILEYFSFLRHMHIPHWILVTKFRTRWVDSHFFESASLQLAIFYNITSLIRDTDSRIHTRNYSLRPIPAVFLHLHIICLFHSESKFIAKDLSLLPPAGGDWIVLFHDVNMLFTVIFSKQQTFVRNKTINHIKNEIRFIHVMCDLLLLILLF